MVSAGASLEGRPCAAHITDISAQCLVAVDAHNRYRHDHYNAVSVSAPTNEKCAPTEGHCVVPSRDRQARGKLSELHRRRASVVDRGAAVGLVMQLQTEARHAAHTTFGDRFGGQL